MKKARGTVQIVVVGDDFDVDVVVGGSRLEHIIACYNIFPQWIFKVVEWWKAKTTKTTPCISLNTNHQHIRTYIKTQKSQNLSYIQMFDVGKQYQTIYKLQKPAGLF